MVLVMASIKRMFFYIDESGNTGLNLFDKAQSTLYYGVISSPFNLDLKLDRTFKKLRKQLGVERLHASELGCFQLNKIAGSIRQLIKKYDISFDFYKVVKSDLALISFFDVIFDPHLNEQVPPQYYNTPLRYLLLFTLSSIIDEGMLKVAWEAKITHHDQNSQKLLVTLCEKIICNAKSLNLDPRAREVIVDSIQWVINNPSKIKYNISSKHSQEQLSPNLIGFQFVLHGIAKKLKKLKAVANKIIVDRQFQFNEAQLKLHDVYSSWSEQREPISLGVDLPNLDFSNIPECGITPTSGDNSSGLELVDLYTWFFKRSLEGKDISDELRQLIYQQKSRGTMDGMCLILLKEKYTPWFECISRAKSKEEFQNFSTEFNEKWHH